MKTGMVKPAPADPALHQAALEWLVTLWSGEVTEQEKQAWQQWHDTSPEHQAAWQQVQKLEQRLHDLPGNLASQTLRASQQPDLQRRRLLRGLGALAAIGATTYAVRRTDSWQLYAADTHTGVGEIREIILSDGTRINLDTASAIDVQFSQHERRIVLRRGHILVTTAHDARPFLVETRQGTSEALGTRFSVKQRREGSCVAVYEGRVRLHPKDNPSQVLVLEAGTRSSFSSTAAGSVQPADEAATAWTRGRLIAENMRLDRFLKILGRYRHGIIRCDEAVADLRVSGVFPLLESDRVLVSLQQALPVEVHWSTPLWVTVQARPLDHPQKNSQKNPQKA